MFQGKPHFMCVLLHLKIGNLYHKSDVILHVLIKTFKKAQLKKLF